MVLTSLILPLLVISLGLITLKSKKYSFLFAILAIIITIIFVVSYTIADSYNNIAFLSDFIYPHYSMVILFSISFILGMSFVLAQNTINYRELGIIIIYFAFSMGILFSNSFVDLIIYWELTSLSATLVILQSAHPNKKYVALKYFVIHSLSGVMIIAGATDFVRAFYTDSFPLENSLNVYNLGNLLILGGILINLALPPFSSWLVDGYSKCSPNASIFLSIFTTKAAIFILFKLFYGSDLLIYIGIFIALYGLIFSLFESSLRRILSMAIIHQLGIMTIGIASLKTFEGFFIAYIFVDVLYKLMAFMLAAILIKRYNTDNIYELKNSINLKSVLGIALLICSLQAVGLPLTGGFIVKTYISSTIELLNEGWLNYVVMFLFAGVALNIGVKIPYYLINFKNTSRKIILENSYSKNITLLITIVLLQTVFILNGANYFSFDYVLHSLEITTLGVFLFILSVFLINTKENKIRVKIDNFKDLCIEASYYTISIITSDKPMIAIHRYFDIWSQRVSKVIKVTTNLSMRYMITCIMIFTILLYLALRYHQITW
ncbi:MAG: hypothetical protein LBH40_04120 [Alphaproteobacteria bacterium]|jgi:multicomponent Na+:H+ antiporter subunit D|nr:hypothetical protein [Alphaproteobacteria bacterium]